MRAHLGPLVGIVVFLSRETRPSVRMPPIVLQRWEREARRYRGTMPFNLRLRDIGVFAFADVPAPTRGARGRNAPIRIEHDIRTYLPALRGRWPELGSPAMLYDSQVVHGRTKDHIIVLLPSDYPVLLDLYDVGNFTED